MSADLFRRVTALGFSAAYAVVAYLLSPSRPDVAILLALFSAFLLGVWFDVALCWRLNSAGERLTESQRKLIELQKERIRVLESRQDDADWWKDN